MPPTLSDLIHSLAGEIMNIPSRYSDGEFSNTAERLLYKEGHRDARRAAVELVLAFANSIEEETE